MRRGLLLTAIAWSLVLSCVASNGVGPGVESPAALKSPGTIVASALATPAPATQPALPPGAAALVARARENLQVRKAVVDAGQVQVLSVQPIDWPDPSLDCPDPEQRFAPRITPGFEIALEAAGRRFEYHTDRGYSIVLCSEGRPVRGLR